MKSARHRLEAAHYLQEGRFHGEAIVRAYFALVAAVRGLLLTKGLIPKTHAGLRTMLGLHFVKTGHLSEDDAAIFSRLQGYREEYDYEMRFFSRKRAEQSLAEAARVVNHIEALV